MTEVLTDPGSLPVGCHALGLYSGPVEAEWQAVRFVSTAPRTAPPVFFVHDQPTADRYNSRLSKTAPDRVGCVVALGHEQVETVKGKLRPVREVQDTLSRHPEGMTAGGDTLSMYLTPESTPAHLEYEEWFDAQPRSGSRFICPYDLRNLPVESAPEILADLGRHHSHVVLSSSPEPAVRLLQLFIFGSRAAVPERLGEDVGWAEENGYIPSSTSNAPLTLTPEGQQVVCEWSDRTTVDW
jgi:hypothetical protein